MNKILISFDPFSYPNWPFTQEQTEIFFTKADSKLNSLCYDGKIVYFNHQKFGPISFSFGNYFKQFYSNTGGRGPLYNAIKKERNSIIIDSTMGSGKDSCLMASWGFQVRCFERHPLLFILLWDGHQKALGGNFLKPAKLMRLHFGSCFDHYLLEQWSQQRVIIYYDPMYPQGESAKKSALPRQNIQFFRELVGADEDIEKNLHLARIYAEKTILKRALHSKWNFKQRLVADLSYKGKNTRYDLFFKQKKLSQSDRII